MSKTQEPLLTKDEVRYILEGIQPSTLSRDELEHALSVFCFPVEVDDRDSDLVGYLAECLKG